MKGSRRGLSLISTAVAVAAPGMGIPVAWAAPATLEEVVVTAQKREERLQDVPVPVTAVSAATLLANNQVRFQDYYSSVPGLNYVPSGQGGGTVSIRGLTPVGGNPVTSFVIDDIPFGASAGAFSGANVIPNLDPSDLERIEVLRGPQGTLYGSDSLGGLIKYVTVNPSTEKMSGRLEADVNTLSRGARSEGYGVRGAWNVPLSDTLAVRFSGFGRRDPGFIDNIRTGSPNVNYGNSAGAHAAALWKPSEAFSVKLSALLQNNTTHAYPFAQVGAPIYPVDQGGQTVQGDLQQSTLPQAGGEHTSVQAYSLTANAKFGAADITFLSGFSRNYGSTSLDFTPLLGTFSLNGFGISPAFPGFGVPGTRLGTINKTDKVTEELRTRMALGSRLDWGVGVFYTHERTSFVQRITAVDSSGNFVGLDGTLDQSGQDVKEYAAFTDLTVKITDTFDIQFGGRESHYSQYAQEVDSGPYATVFEGASPTAIAPTRASDNKFTYLITPRFKVTPDLMVYARAASGYRAGGPNSLAVVTESNGRIPRQFKPDTTKNYEVGVKGDVFDRALSFDFSVYYISWKNIQIGAIEPNSNLGYNGNGGDAKSQGIELSIEAHPWTGLTVSPWIAYTEAVLTQDLQNLPPGSFGLSGDRLPNSARLTGSLPIQQTFQLGSGVTGFVGGTLSYVGNQLDTLLPTPPVGSPITPRQYHAGYARTDVRMGGRTDDWSVTLYCNNLMDKRAITGGGVGGLFPNMFTYIQPRTVGLTVSRSFD